MTKGAMLNPKFLAHLITRLAAAFSFVVIAACSAAPPVQEMSDARQAIHAARGADAATHAPDLLLKAQQYLKEAESKLQQKAYNSAKHDAIAAKKQALEALEMSSGAQNERGGEIPD